MDVFNYYLRKLERFPKEATVRDLEERTLRTIEGGPELVGADTAVAFLLALWSWRDAPDGLELGQSFRAVRRALDFALDSIEAEVAAGDSLRTMPEPMPEEMPEPERMDPDGPLVLSFENWPEWDAGQWVRFDYEQREAMRAAQGGLEGIGRAAELLANVRANVHKLPAEQRVSLTIWAQRLADEIHDRTEEAVDEMGRAYLYTREGCQRRNEIVRKRRRNFVVFRRGGVTEIKCFLA